MDKENSKILKAMDKKRQYGGRDDQSISFEVNIEEYVLWSATQQQTPAQK